MHPLEDPRTKLTELINGFREFAGLHAGGQSPEIIADLTLDLYRLTDLVDAVRADICAEATLAMIPNRDGLKRISDWVALHTPAATAPVARDNKTGDWLRRYPTLRTAALNGHLNSDRLRLIRKCENHRTRNALQESQDIFVFMAKELSWKDFETAIGYWMALHDPDGDLPKEQHNDRKATLNKDRSTGVTRGNFTLDPTNGTTVETAINQEISRLQNHDKQTGNKRTTAQLTADAITNLIQRGATRQDSTLPAPLLHIVLGYKTAQELCLRFNHQPGDPHPTPGPIPIDPSDPDWRCELIDGTPIHPHTAYKHLGNARIRRIIVDATGKTGCFAPEQVIDLSKLIRPQGHLSATRLQQLIVETPSVPLGSKQRVFSPHLAQAAMIAGRARCTTRGCNAPAHWLQTDHHHPHSRGGPTHLNNAQLLCRHHNAKKSNHLPPTPIPTPIQVPARK